MYTVPGVNSITHDDQTASLYAGQGDKQGALMGVVRLSDAVSVILASDAPQLGGLTQAPVRTVPPRPAITSISPNTGPTAGGTEVEIGGDALADTSAVFFGANSAQSFSLVSINGPIHAVTPVGAGTVDVTVTTPGGTSATTSVAQYSYADPPLPIVSNVSPSSGQAGGGDTVQVLVGSVDTKTVQGFLFGSVPSPSFSLQRINMNGTVSYLVQTPPNNGKVNVTVLTTVGSSSPAAGNLFTFVAPPQAGPPAITAVSPATGVTIGGTVVRIEGSDLGDASSVMFGNVAAESFAAKLLSPANTVVLDAVSPCGQAAGPVTVTTLRGTSAVTNASQYTYTAPAVLKSLSFAAQSVGTASGAASTTLPLQVSLHDLPQNLVITIQGNPTLDLVLQHAGLGPQFTVGQFIAAFGDITATYSIAALSFDRNAADFSYTTAGGGAGPVTVSVTFKPVTKGYRANILRASVGGLHLSGAGAAGVLAAFANLVAPSLAPLVNGYVAVLVEGSGS